MSVTVRSFTADYELSLSYADADRQLLASHFGVQVEAVEKTPSEMDRQGVDYLVSLPDGATVTVDMKRRSRGSSRCWRDSTVPELGIELEACPGKPGPLVSDRPLPDYWALYVADLDRLYLLSCEPLRAATRANFDRWAHEYPFVEHRTLRADGSYYRSPTIYVPLPVVQAAMQRER